MATREEIFQAIRNADAAGDSEAVQKLGAYLKTMDAAPVSSGPAKSDARKIGEANPSLRTTAANGPLFGFGDEIGGAIVAAIKGIPGLDKGAEGTTFKQRYEGYRDYLRGQESAAKEQQPIVANALQIAASLPTAAAGGVGGNVVKGTNALWNVARAGAAGLTSGAIQGAGASEADDAAGVGLDALKSGAIGAGTGAVAQPIISAMGGGVGRVYKQFNDAAARGDAPVKVAEAIARDARGNVFRDGVDSAGSQAAARLRKLGDEARVVDAGGQSTRSLLDTMATLPGSTKQAAETAIRDRQASRAGRLIGAADEALGANGRRMAATVDDLVAQRSAAAAPLYAKVHAMDVPVNPELASIISAADQLGATKLGAKLATAERVPYDLAADSSSASVRDLDRLKQALDAMIQNEGTNAVGRTTPVGASLTKLRDSLVKQVDTATNGAYAEARSAFAGPSRIIDAVQAGRKALTQDDASIRALTQGMGDSELEGLRIGAFEALRAKLGTRAGQTQMMEMWREPAVQEKLKAIFGTERAYRDFASRVAAEGRMKGLETVGRGSQTAARQYAAGDLDVNPLSEAATAMTGNPLSMVQAGMRAWNRVQMPEATRDEIGRILLSRGNDGVNEIQRVNELIRQMNAQRAVSASRAGSVVGMSAADLFAPR